MSLENLPPINASLNGLAFIFLLLGFRAVKRKDISSHKKYVIGAFLSSTVFLVCYLIYHFNVQAITHYHRGGILKIIYLSILISHVTLAVFIPPVSIAALVTALKQKYETHKKITRILWPGWVYVSSTGVLIYFMLYQW